MSDIRTSCLISRFAQRELLQDHPNPITSCGGRVFDDNHRWSEDDYFGASLAEFHELFQAHDYFLACCNITGANAFFIKKEYRSAFPEIPDRVESIYASPKYYLCGLDFSGHKTSLKTIARIFSRLNSPQ